jgi:hypothetical protein
MGDTDPTHWLHRLSPDEWLAAADTELAHCQETLSRRAFRPGVTHARRAAGMALNAVLALREDNHYGRSYMDHVMALAQDKTAPDHARSAAEALRHSPSSAPPLLLTLGKLDLRALEDARRVVAYARARVATLRAPLV